MSETLNWYYSLSAKGIQEYILRGDKLRLMIGASELVEDLPKEFLAALLRGLGAIEESDYQVVSRAAGNARLLFGRRETAEQLAMVLSLAISEYAPGLDVVQDLRAVSGGLAATIDAAEEQLQRRRNLLYPALPLGGPLVTRSPRSGLPAEGFVGRRDARELADAGMIAKTLAASSARSALASLVGPCEAADAKMAEDLEDLVRRDGEYLAVVHADCNRLGTTIAALLHELVGDSDRQVAATIRDFSGAIEKATRQALQAALEQIPTLENSAGTLLHPFRPLICAGDDVTVILRACDAMGFVRRLLEELEQRSTSELARVRADCLKGTCLTACAGVAFVHSHFPFYQAYRLCESLCSFAKDQTQRRGSAVAFWRVSASVTGDFASELTASDGTRLTMMPYGVGQASPAPRLDALTDLVKAAKAMPRGSLRQVADAMRVGDIVAQQAYARVREVVGTRLEESQPGAALGRFEAALSSLTCALGQGALWREVPGGKRETPLVDALELLAVAGVAP